MVFGTSLVPRHARRVAPTSSKIFHPMFATRDPFATLFAHPWRILDAEPFGVGEFGDLAPKVDVSETDKAYEITVELPGMDDKDVEVNVVGDRLTISGEKKVGDGGADRHLSERAYGAFGRTFKLPDEVNAGKVSAAFRNGVLTVGVPKAVAAQKRVKKIAIKRS